MTNEDRADMAQAALIRFMVDTGMPETEEAIQDLITDLLHLANREKLNVLDILQRATLVFCDEASEKETV
jgi:hypothetical protein